MLLPFGWLYGGVVALRNWGYDRGWLNSERVPVPVVSVGNLSTGGTGKTPMAEYLLRYLLEEGHRPAYLSRGYGRETKGYLRVVPDRGDGRMYGDEALQVGTRFSGIPVAVCEDRVAGVRRLLSEAPDTDVVVLDDAFQHRRIVRDLDLVMVDANRLPWRDLVLPAGNRREPLSGLDRADLLVFSKCRSREQAAELVERYGKKVPAVAFAVEQHGPEPFWEGMEVPEGGERVVAFAGLGNNAHFFEQVRARFPGLDKTFAFADHHPYRASDLGKILAEAGWNPENSTNFGGALVLTSEKDFFRLRNESWLREWGKPPLFYLPVTLRPLLGESVLKGLLEQMFDQYHGKNT